MDRMNNCFIRNSDNPARVILFVNDVRRIDDLRARKSCGTRINRIIIYFGNCSGRYFSAEKIPSSFCIYLSPLRSIDRVCFNNLPVERWSNCIFTGLPPSLTWLIVSRNSSDCWTIEILWSGKRNELNSCSSFYYWLGNGNFYIETRLFSGNWFYPFILAHDTTILPN